MDFVEEAFYNTSRGNNYFLVRKIFFPSEGDKFVGETRIA